MSGVVDVVPGAGDARTTGATSPGIYTARVARGGMTRLNLDRTASNSNELEQTVTPDFGAT